MPHSQSFENIVQLNAKIDELLFWTRYSLWKTFIADLRVNLRDDSEKMIYQLSNGSRSSREISRIISANGKSVTHVTIVNLWQKWETIPLVMKTDKSGRYKKVVSLKAAGIECPKIEIPKYIFDETYENEK